MPKEHVWGVLQPVYDPVSHLILSRCVPQVMGEPALLRVQGRHAG